MRIHADFLTFMDISSHWSSPSQANTIYWHG